jgi:hypothetical protein
MADYELQDLQALRRQRDAIEKLIVEVVASSRRKGHSWEEIGRQLGITRQGAFQRYGQADPHRSTSP